MKVLVSSGGPVPKELREGLPLLEPEFDVGNLPTPGASPAYPAPEGSE